MKRYITLIAAAALVACSNEELSTPENLATSQAPVNFEAYTQRGLTRAGARGDIDNNNITGIGFGVFGYYTAGALYDQKATPNFMYNERVSNSGSGWAYEPVKYWPNEYGTNAKSDEVDRLTFFAYAPWTEVDPTTGNVLGDPNHDIVSVNKHGATGDPLVKYVVDTDPATSVDLLWGVAADNPDNYYKAIQGTVDITAGKPFIDLVKPNDPANHKLSFNLKHALAKVKVTIDFIADANTPEPAQGQTAGTIYPEETRIYVRNFKMSGFALQGALNLNNTTADKPLWKDFDGAADLAFDEVIFQDGRKDGKEGETNGAQTNETPVGLNPEIVENFCQTTTANGVTVFGANKKQGVTATAQNLFGGSETENGGYFYIIPRNEGSGVDVEIAYDVETIDRKLVGKLSDNETHGISIENVISKEKIFGDGVDFEPGKAYEIKIHIGMTSMKVDAEVLPWDAVNSQNVDLPANQDGAGTGGNGGNNQQTYPYWTIGTDDTKYYTDPTNISPTYYYVKDATSWQSAIEAGPLAAYYDDNPNEAKAADDDPTILNNGFVYTDHTTGNKHTWYAEVKAPKAGPANYLPWIVIDMNYTPAFEGTIHMKYNGTDSTPWGTNWNKPGRKWAVCAVSDPDFVNGSISPYTGYDSYTYGGTLTGTNFAPDLLEVTLERGNVTKHEQ